MSKSEDKPSQIKQLSTSLNRFCQLRNYCIILHALNIKCSSFNNCLFVFHKLERPSDTRGAFIVISQWFVFLHQEAACYTLELGKVSTILCDFQTPCTCSTLSSLILYRGLPLQRMLNLNSVRFHSQTVLILMNPRLLSLPPLSLSLLTPWTWTSA